MTDTYYMHTLNGKPAAFDGNQISYATFHGKPNALAESLQQIRSEQRASAAYRRRMGFTGYKMEYGHFRFVAVSGKESGQ